MGTTFRRDVTAALVDIIDAFTVAHPSLVRRSERARPPSIVGDMPIAFVDGRRENISHTSGIRERVMTPSVVVVSPLADNVETVVRHDQLVDLLVDHFTRYPHIIPITIWDRMAVDDEDYSVDSDDGTSRHFFATRFTFGNLSIMEGRTDPPKMAFIPPQATYEAIALALNAAGILNIANPPGATGESISLELIAIELLSADAVDEPTVTPEQLIDILVAAGLMAAA